MKTLRNKYQAAKKNLALAKANYIEITAELKHCIIDYKHSTHWQESRRNYYDLEIEYKQARTDLSNAMALNLNLAISKQDVIVSI